MDQYRGALPVQERLEVEQVVSLGKAAARKLTHARILLLADERKGGCHQLMLGEPWRGWRHGKVTERRTRRDYAACIRELVAMPCPQAQRIRLVQAPLNTHDGASLYETFAPAEARRSLEKIALHDTPTHGSWLNMAATESNIMHSQCLHRRLDSQSLRAAAVAAWAQTRNRATVRIHWTFTLAVARRKLRKLYPSIED